MADFKKEFLDAVANRKGDVADAVGMPDEGDYQVLMNIIRKYQKQFPGYLEAAVKQGRRDYELGIHRKKQVFDTEGRAVVSKDSNMVYAFELPSELGRRIEAVFPSIFRSKKHFAWFKKSLPKLMIGGQK